MAIKLNPNALQDKAIEEAKLSQGVQDKLNRGGVEEAPIDGRPYVRQDAGWVGYEYPETEPVVREFTEVGTYTIQVPIGKHYCRAFIVNGGNSGATALTDIHWTEGALYAMSYGGRSKEQVINVVQTSNIIITVGAGGASTRGTNIRGNRGEISSIEYNNIIYSPEENPENYLSYYSPSSFSPTNGVLNPFNPSDTNLYGAGGQIGASYDDEFYPGDYGITGGGHGEHTGYIENPGTFFGAAGACDSYRASAGYRGYVYLKFT